SGPLDYLSRWARATRARTTISRRPRHAISLFRVGRSRQWTRPGPPAVAPPRRCPGHPARRACGQAPAEAATGTAAGEVTVVDASPEMLAMASARLGNDDRVTADPATGPA